MSVNFPTSLDSYAALVDNTDNIIAAHPNNRGDAIEALEAKVGVDGSAVITSHDYLLTHLPGQAQNWDAGSYEIRALTFESDATTGTAPLTIASTTPVDNLGIHFDHGYIASEAQGDILYRGAGAWARLVAGTAGQFLKTGGAGANPSWTSGFNFIDGTYTGDGGTSQTISGVGFTSKLIILTAHSNNGSYRKTDNMATSWAFYSDHNVDVYENDMITINADGFIVGDGTGGSGENPNASGNTWSYVCIG